MDIPVGLNLPLMFKVHQKLEAPVVADIAGTVRAELQRVGIASQVRPGMRIALTAGSRGVANIATVLATVAQVLKELGAEPFIVPTMGSHGGATPEGQVGVLEGLGVTESSVGVPIVSSLEVVQIGTSPEGAPVYLDRNAWEADGILVIGRVKPHTDFDGPIESGLMKMMVIGLGKHRGALSMHRMAVTHGFQTMVPSMARVTIEKARILCGLALVENAYDQTARIEAVLPADIEREEMKLLELAKKLMARLPYTHVDILIVDEIGKDISGSGLDPNVIGRVMNIASPEPALPVIKRIIVRDLSEATHGNAIGVGKADFTTRRLFQKMDPWPTYVNSVTGGAPAAGRIPIVCENDRQALDWALTTIGAVEPEDARIVWIKNTLDLEDIMVARSLLPETAGRTDLEVTGGPVEMRYDAQGDLVEVFARRRAGVLAHG